MSNIDKARIMRGEFNEPDVFNGVINLRQLWWIVKLLKLLRIYARSNAALYNFLNELFRDIASFSRVEKKNKQGVKYMGLKITMLASDNLSDNNYDGDEDMLSM